MVALRSRRCAAWWVGLALWALVAVPALAPASGGQRGFAAEVCSVQGSRVVPPAGSSDGDAPASALHGHCVLCSVHPQPAVAPASTDAVAPAQACGTADWHAAASPRERRAWLVSAPPRAPPARPA
jgi:hypothetical protein